MSPSDISAASRLFVGGVLAAILLLPLAVADLAPCADLPAHLALIEALHHIGTDGHLLAAHFELGVFPAPNTALPLLTYALSLVFGTLLAGKIAAGLVLLALLAASAFYLVSFRRSLWLLVFVFPLCYSWLFTEGFLDYLLGLALVLASLAYLQRHLDDTRIRTQGLVAAGLFLATLLAHALAFAFLLLGVLVLLAAHRLARGSRIGLRRLLCLLGPPAGLCASIAVVWLVLAWEQLCGRGASGLVFEPLAKLYSIGWTSVLFMDGGSLLRGLWGLIFAAALVVWWSGRAAGGRSRAGLFVGLFPLVMALVWLAAPRNLWHFWALYHRIPSLIWILVACSLLPRRSPAVRGLKAGLAVAAACALGLHALLIHNLGQWNAYTSGLFEALGAAGEQTKLAYYPEQRGPTGFESYLWRHLGQYHTVQNQGLSSYSFAQDPGRLLRDARERSFQYVRSGQLAELCARREYRYLLQAGETRLERRWPGCYSLVERRGLWSLYAIGPRGDSLGLLP
ncbi:MAG: hypothetical protein JXR96_06705 [Deltaproteobacteria bacterium]|nr:hypothetical protein [Deltaproteobacteria bacterium]